MAKTKNKKQRTSPPIYERKFGEIKAIFPKIQTIRWSEKNPGKAGRDFFVDIIIPNSYTLISKSVKENGEIMSITFSVQKKHCTENQRPGIYSFSA